MEIPNNQVSSSTLEQLREFESVLEQVKERSTSSSQSAASSTTDNTSTAQTQTGGGSTGAPTTAKQVSVSALTQQLLMPSQSPSSGLEFPSSNGNALAFQQQEVSLVVSYISGSGQFRTGKEPGWVAASGVAGVRQASK